ncbi:Tenascin-X [Orchesella cincta]|uniref:Tenascin-X n=1 Tax=Orchesella cincta TaxID=48709 RepID=A0A1D2NC30_ORCCI|nr:Tenascin-X [Orchesella cincta]
MRGRCEFDDEFGNADDKLECIQNSECVGLGVCQCKAGFKQSPEGKCLLKYGEKCNDTEGLVCNYKYEHLICQAGICGCEFYGQQAFQPEIQTCRWLVGEDCDITQDDGHNQPAGFPRLRRCVNDAFCKPFRPGHHKGTCVCKRGFEISSEKTCTKDRGHGRPCSASMDCDKKRYLECIPDEEQGSHCECLQNEMYFDGKECRVFPGKSCQQNNLCALNSYCEGEWCVCNEGYQIGNSDCFPVTRRHGHSLELPSDNFSHPYPEMSCDETFLGNVERLKCKCQMKVNSHTWSTEKVACLALVGNQCFSDEDCIDYAMCDSDGYTCQCSSAAHTTTNRTCVLKSTVPKDLDTNENAGDWTERMHKLKSIRADESSNETANDGTGIPFSLKMVAFETQTNLFKLILMLPSQLIEPMVSPKITLKIMSVQLFTSSLIRSMNLN